MLKVTQTSAQRACMHGVTSEQNAVAKQLVNRRASTQTLHGGSVRPFSCS